MHFQGSADQAFPRSSQPPPAVSSQRWLAEADGTNYLRANQLQAQDNPGNMGLPSSLPSLSSHAQERSIQDNHSDSNSTWPSNWSVDSRDLDPNAWSPEAAWRAAASMNWSNIPRPPGLSLQDESAGAASNGSQPDGCVPVLLWCEVNPTSHSGCIDAVARNFSEQQFMYFQTPVKFTRWLFQQQRGTMKPWAVLVVGWREAKPCAHAIAA
ncbi:unnamed protein product, partial [Polarella glacialis]